MIIIHTAIKVWIKTVVYSVFLTYTVTVVIAVQCERLVQYFGSFLQGYVSNNCCKKLIMFLLLRLFSTVAYVKKMLGDFSRIGEESESFTLKLI
jgi:hypothetical protein